VVFVFVFAIMILNMVVSGCLFGGFRHSSCLVLHVISDVYRTIHEDMSNKSAEDDCLIPFLIFCSECTVALSKMMPSDKVFFYRVLTMMHDIGIHLLHALFPSYVLTFNPLLRFTDRIGPPLQACFFKNRCYCTIIIFTVIKYTVHPHTLFPPSPPPSPILSSPLRPGSASGLFHSRFRTPNWCRVQITRDFIMHPSSLHDHWSLFGPKRFLTTFF
jgi:hypothetical protein